MAAVLCLITRLDSAALRKIRDLVTLIRECLAIFIVIHICITMTVLIFGLMLFQQKTFFASEMIGALHDADPRTGRYCDDTKRNINRNKGLSRKEKRQIFSGNTRRVFPRLKTSIL